MQPTKESLDILLNISSKIEDRTFHHHYHILYDIAKTFPADYLLTYLEIGCFAGGSACLMLQRPNTEVTSIDLGTPVPRTVAIENTSKVNIYSNYYHYIEGSSHNLETYNQVSNKQFDILFIDGDHSHQGVKKDFALYSPLVKFGGYIVFDDYNDAQHSPEVKPAVDDIVNNMQDYEVLGTFSNTLGARPQELLAGNCFVLKKKT